MLNSPGSPRNQDFFRFMGSSVCLARLLILHRSTLGISLRQEEFVAGNLEGEELEPCSFK